MADLLRTRATIKIGENVQALGASDLERVAWMLVAIREGRDDLLLRGHDERGHFIKTIVDAFAERGDLAVQCGAVKSYFAGDFEKPLKDLEKALKQCPELQRLYLFSTAATKPTRHSELLRRLRTALGTTAHGERDVFVYDRRRIAEQLFDEVTKRTELVQAFAPYLPSVMELMLEFSYDNLVPLPTAHFVGRDLLVSEVCSRLARDRVCALYGVSGTGKSEVAKAVGHKDGLPWVQRIWVDGPNRPPFSFASVHVHRIGRKANLISRMKEAATLVILDNWAGPIEQVTEAFQAHAHDKSALLLTMQYLNVTSMGMAVGGLDQAASTRLLVPPDVTRPPKEILAEIIRVTGGNPLALSLLRSLVEHDGVDWNGIVGELKAVGEIAAGGTSLGELLLEQHAKVVAKVLAALGFLRTSIIEPNLLRAMTGHSQFAAARQREFLRDIDGARLQAHDLVRTIAEERAHNDRTIFDAARNRFWAHIQVHLPRPPYHLVRALNLHRNVVEEAALAERKPGLAVRAYLNLEESAHNHALMKAVSESPIDVSSWEAATSVIDAMEARVRLCRDKQAKNDLCKAFATRLELALEERIPNDLVKTALLHHLGKMQLWTSRPGSAAERFRAVLELEPDFTAARLQLAKALAETNAEQAREELATVLSAARDPAELQTASVTVLLAAFEQLTERAFEPLLNEFLLSDPAGFLTVLDLAVTENFAQPYAVVARLVSRIGYPDPKAALKLLSQIPLPDPASDDDRLNSAAGQIQIAYHDALERTGAPVDTYRRAAALALAYFDRVREWPDPEERRNVAKAYYRSEQYDIAIRLLEGIPDENASAFVSYDLAKVYRAVGRFKDGLSRIEVAIQALEPRATPRFRPTFVRLRGFLRADDGDVAGARADLQTARDEATDARFREQLVQELEKLEGPDQLSNVKT